MQRLAVIALVVVLPLSGVAAAPSIPSLRLTPGGKISRVRRSANLPVIRLYRMSDTTLPLSQQPNTKPPADAP